LKPHRFRVVEPNRDSCILDVNEPVLQKGMRPEKTIVLVVVRPGRAVFDVQASGAEALPSWLEQSVEYCFDTTKFGLDLIH
jgi:hypothetical protein